MNAYVNVGEVCMLASSILAGSLPGLIGTRDHYIDMDRIQV